MPAKPEYTRVVPAVDQASRILLCLAGNASASLSLTDICEAVGIYKSKGYSILNTLQKFGFVLKDPATKTYSLGLGLISLSRKVLDGLNDNKVVAPLLETLARRTHSTALYSTLSDENIFVVAKHEEERTVSVTIRVGYRFHMTHGAHGKAIVAFMEEDEREKLLKQKKLFFHGNASKFDRGRLDAELARCRETGYAFDMGELNPGINVVASPVFDADERIKGCVFIMGTFSESLVEEYGALVAGSARRFSTLLGARAPRGAVGRSG
jgi:DNA-binding IclR family transcriptional regulator